MEEEAERYFEKIDALGGVIPAIEQGFFQREIAEAAYRYQFELDKKEKIIVGVNEFRGRRRTDHNPDPGSFSRRGSETETPDFRSAQFPGSGRREPDARGVAQRRHQRDKHHSAASCLHPCVRHPRRDVLDAGFGLWPARRSSNVSETDRKTYQGTIMKRSHVAVLKTTPATVLEDYRRLAELAGMRSALDPGAPTILKDNISWHFPFPAANTTPWQLEGSDPCAAGTGISGRSPACRTRRLSPTRSRGGPEPLSSSLPAV